MTYIMAVATWFRNNIIAILLNIVLLLVGYALYVNVKTTYEANKNPPELKEFKGVQNHLVWDVQGKCFFIRPHNDYTNYLISVPDCDKK